MQNRKTELEIEKIMLESRKLQLEIFWYPVAIAIAFMSSIVGATLGVLKLFGKI
jgi:hypothetical protein